MPSLTEGLPIALLEAMSYGLAIVASRVGGCPDLITDGDNGFLVTPADSSRLADAIGDLINSSLKREIFGLKAYAQVSENYNMSKYANSFLELYRNILS